MDEIIKVLACFNVVLIVQIGYILAKALIGTTGDLDQQATLFYLVFIAGMGYSCNTNVYTFPILNTLAYISVFNPSFEVVTLGIQLNLNFLRGKIQQMIVRNTKILDRQIACLQKIYQNCISSQINMQII